MSDKQVNISKYLDSTFLKTSGELGVSNSELEILVTNFINEAIDYDFKCIMIRPIFVSLAKKIKDERKSKINVGTVVDFPLGSNSLKSKIKEAEIAINDGVKELDFVCDYNTFKMGNYTIFDESIFECTKFALSHKVIVKWIIETGALSKVEIKLISERIYNIVLENFPEKILKVFIKTSTGYYGGYGATIIDVKVIKSVIGNMPIKASGGVSDFATCQEMIKLGVSRIGTSKALNIYQEYHS